MPAKYFMIESFFFFSLEMTEEPKQLMKIIEEEKEKYLSVVWNGQINCLTKTWDWAKYFWNCYVLVLG